MEGFFWLRIGTSGGAVVSTVMNLQVALIAGKLLSSWAAVGF
jgi:hypothetical protein